MRRLTLALTVLSALAVPRAASAQAWDAPTFFSPVPGEDLGLYVVKPDGGGDVGFAGIWRQSGNINLGVRAGIAGDVISVGGEYYGPVALLGPQSQVQFSWVLGFGASFNDDVTWLRVPLGLSAGVTLGAGGTTVTPYVHPRVALDFVAVGTGQDEETDTEFNVPIDVGADVTLGESFVLRVGATFDGSASAFGAGVAYRMSRRLVVR